MKKGILSKKLIAIISLCIVMTGVAFYYGYTVSQNAKIEFVNDGFVLAQANTKERESRYFKKGDKFTKSYPNKISFTDKDGNQVGIDNDNYIHYMNNDVMSFSKGVFFDSDQMNNQNMIYYNFPANKVLSKAGDSYEVKNANETLKMKNVIWKISDSKYLILSDKIEVTFAKDNNKSLEDYVELSFVDKGIVYLSHQQGTYQTVSSDASIVLANGVKLNLSDKTVMKDNKEILSLTQMVVDANDNIEIIEKEVEEAKKDNEEGTGENAGDNTTPGGVGGSGTSGGGTNNEGTTENPDSGSNTENKPDAEDPTDSEADTTKIFPIFELTEFENDIIKCSANIEITDDDDLLSSDTTVKIVERGSNKTVYENKFTAGIYNINILTESLKPDTEYTLIANASYTYLEETYNKDFISQVFTTDSLGISFKKNYLDTNEISILVQSQKYSTVTDGELVLYDTSGNVLETQTISMNAAKLDPEYSIAFKNLTNNTEYIVKLENLIYDSSVVMEYKDINQKFKTLKKLPTIGEAVATVNQNASNVTLSTVLTGSDEGIIDPDSGITRIEYQIYQTSQIVDGVPNSQPIKTITKDNKSSIDVSFDGEVLKRRVGYTYRIIAYFQDNEKTVELTNGFSAPFSLNSDAYPTVRFDIARDNITDEEIGLKHDSVSGTAVINDESRMIKQNTYIKWSMVANDGGKAKTGSYYYDGNNGLAFPIVSKNLKKETSYFVSITATIKDESTTSGFQESYIGGFRFTTSKPEDILVTLDEPEKLDYTQAFDYELQLNDIPAKEDKEQESSAYEASCLKNIELYLYPEDNLEGTSYRTQITNESPMDDPEQYDYTKNTIKLKLYDNHIIISPKTFGLTSQDIVEKYYTLVVKNAVDYTDHENNINLTNTENDVICKFKITPHGFIPSLPEKLDQALEVKTILNLDTKAGNEYEGKVSGSDSLRPDTVVGFDVFAKTFPTVGMPYARSVTYQMYKITSYNGKKPEGIMIKEKTIEVEDKLATTLPRWVFGMGEGVTRGEQYYFTYTVKMDISKDGSGTYDVIYPNDAEGGIVDGKVVVLSSQKVDAPKETPVIRTTLLDTDATKNQTWLYSVNDIDNTFTNGSANESQIIVTDGASKKYAEWLVEDEATGLYKLSVPTVTSPATLTVEKQYRRYNTSTGDGVTNTSSYLLFNQPMIANNDAAINNIKYSLEVTSSKLIISFGKEDTSHVAGIKATITSNKSRTNPIVIDYLAIDELNQTQISLMEIKEFLGTEITVGVSAYYAKQQSGVNNAKTRTFIMQKYNITDGYKYVDGNSVSTKATYSLYHMTSDNFKTFEGSYIASLKQNTSGLFTATPVSNTKGEVSYSYDTQKGSTFNFRTDRQGLNTDNSGNTGVDSGKYYIFRETGTKNLDYIETNKVKFDYIVPEVKTVKTVPELINVNLSFDYDGFEKSAIKDNKIYIQFTDKDGNDSKNIGFEKPFDLTLTKDSYRGEVKQNLDEVFLKVPLVEGQSYWFKLYVEFQEGETIVKKSLVDSDYPKQETTIYSFKTVSDIGLKLSTTTSPYIYKSDSHQIKSMNFNFNVDYASGYTMQFNLIDKTSNKIIDLGDYGEKATFITSHVNTLTLNVGKDVKDVIPGVNDLLYGSSYELTGVATTASGTEVGKMKIDFVLKKLDDPTVYVSSKTDVDTENLDKAKLDYTITLDDKDYVITDGKYIVKVYKGEKPGSNSPVYEEEIKLTSSVSAKNITLKNLEKNQTYSLVIEASIDAKYNGTPTQYNHTYKTITINEFGLSIGKTYTELIKDTNKTFIQLNLYDTVGFTNVKRVNYSIIDITDGKTKYTITDEVITTKTSGNVTSIKLATDIATLKSGRYGLSIQYLDGQGTVIASDSSLDFSISGSIFTQIMNFFGLD